MALIPCPECSREISDRVSSCPHCGFPMKELDESVPSVSLPDAPAAPAPESPGQSNEEPAKSKGPMRIIAVLVVIALLIGGVFAYQSQLAVRNAASERENYIFNLNMALVGMVRGGAEAEELLNKTGLVWHNSIWNEADSTTNKYTVQSSAYARHGDFAEYSGRDFEEDFNTALVRLFDDVEIMSKVALIKENQKAVRTVIQELQNPPDGFDRVLETLTETHSAYRRVTDLAVNPTGSLNSFNDARRERIENLVDLLGKLQTQIPPN